MSGLNSLSEPLLVELSSPGRCGANLPELDVPESELPPAELLRSDLPLPEVSELDVVRHFTRLSQLNFSIDTNFYPLGSCTMKYNPKLHEVVARYTGFAEIHPYQPVETVQGALQLLYELQGYLAEITGMDAATLQPAAGAQGELAGILLIKAHHESRGDHSRRIVLVPDSAHGTNPATAAMCGYRVVALPSNRQGTVDLEELDRLMTNQVAGLMITNPNTVGLFERDILEISRIVHERGGLIYGDGANLNALLGWAKPGELGIDVFHVNTHKTLTTPHGGGGPGAGPVCCKSMLAPFLPGPLVIRSGDRYELHTPERSIGRLKSFYGNFGVLVRAYAYIRTLGEVGLREIAENATLNANYIRAELDDRYELPYDRPCMHEVVFSGSRQKAKGVRTLDIAKRLIDFGIHPPTVYFPLIVEEAIMIEPTETESKQTLDHFIRVMRQIADEAATSPVVIHSAPHNTPVSRLDEATAARKPTLHW